jgi:hypothetical protein
MENNKSGLDKIQEKMLIDSIMNFRKEYECEFNSPKDGKLIKRTVKGDYIHVPMYKLEPMDWTISYDFVLSDKAISILTDRKHQMTEDQYEECKNLYRVNRQLGQYITNFHVLKTGITFQVSIDKNKDSGPEFDKAICSSSSDQYGTYVSLKPVNGNVLHVTVAQPTHEINKNGDCFVAVKEEPVAESNNCKCPIDKLLAYGCKCGGA